MSYKLTIDVNLMKAEPVVDGMETLKRWKEEGKVELIDSDPPKVATPAAYGWPGAPPKPPENKPTWGARKPRSKKMSDSGNATFKSVAAVLFPGKDSQKLHMGEINEVTHLIRHHASKNEIFVTVTNSYLEGGRRDLLKHYFGIVAMTPTETVKTLSEMEGWKESEGKKSKAKKK